MSIKKYVESIPVGPLAIVALSGSKQLGEAVDAYIADWRSQRIELKNHLLLSRVILKILTFLM